MDRMVVWNDKETRADVKGMYPTRPGVRLVFGAFLSSSARKGIVPYTKLRPSHTHEYDGRSH
jgi:hypothetical protein